MRHPCVEEQMAKNINAVKKFVPNDCVMGSLKGEE